MSLLSQLNPSPGTSVPAPVPARPVRTTRRVAAAAAVPADTAEISTPAPPASSPSNDDYQALRNARVQQLQQEEDGKYAAQYDRFAHIYQTDFPRWSQASGGRNRLTADDLDRLTQSATSPDERAVLSTMADNAKAYRGTGMTASFTPDAWQLQGMGHTRTEPIRKALDDTQLGQMYRSGLNKSAFMSVFQDNFEKWNQLSGNKGYLTQADVDKLMGDSSIQGRDAAALDALKSLETTSNGMNQEVTFARDGVTFRAGSKGTGAGATSSVASWDSPQVGTVGDSYNAALQNIEQTPSRLFGSPDGLPHVDDIHQGVLGNCYFLSPLASLTAQNPRAVKNMITQVDANTYSVKFPGIAQPIKVSAPTAAEIGNYGTAGRGGLWQSVLMKAYGQAYQNQGEVPHTPGADQTGIEPYDSVGNGGPAYLPIMQLTGQGVDDVMLPGAFASNPTLAAAITKMDKLPELRARLARNLQQKRIVTAGTPNAPPDPSQMGNLVGGHVYSVLAYDPTTDRITLRNPWGNNGPMLEYLPPNAMPGSHNDGTFTLSFNDFVHMFSNITMGNGGPMNPMTSEGHR